VAPLDLISSLPHSGLCVQELDENCTSHWAADRMFGARPLDWVGWVLASWWTLDALENADASKLVSAALSDTER